MTISDCRRRLHEMQTAHRESENAARELGMEQLERVTGVPRIAGSGVMVAAEVKLAGKAATPREIGDLPR